MYLYYSKYYVFILCIYITVNIMYLYFNKYYVFILCTYITENFMYLHYVFILCISITVNIMYLYYSKYYVFILHYILCIHIMCLYYSKYYVFILCICVTVNTVDYNKYALSSKIHFPDFTVYFRPTLFIQSCGRTLKHNVTRSFPNSVSHNSL